MGKNQPFSEQITSLALKWSTYPVKNQNKLTFLIFFVLDKLNSFSFRSRSVTNKISHKMYGPLHYKPSLVFWQLQGGHFQANTLLFHWLVCSYLQHSHRGWKFHIWTLPFYTLLLVIRKQYPFSHQKTTISHVFRKQDPSGRFL